jgi:hypothetical protein
MQAIQAIGADAFEIEQSSKFDIFKDNPILVSYVYRKDKSFCPFAVERNPTL